MIGRIQTAIRLLLSFSTLAAFAFSPACCVNALAEGEKAKAQQADIPEDQPSNPLEAAIARMREAQKRIESRDTGSETRKIQQQVADDLARLIQMAEQNSSRSRRRQPSPSQPQTGEESQQQPDTSQEGEPRPSPGQRDRTDNAAESQDRQLQGEAKNVETREQGATAQVWGHLPERLRQRLRNIDAGKTLPKYSDLVRRYFESLAEQGQKDRQE